MSASVHHGQGTFPLRRHEGEKDVSPAVGATYTLLRATFAFALFFFLPPTNVKPSHPHNLPCV